MSGATWLCACLFSAFLFPPPPPAPLSPPPLVTRSHISQAELQFPRQPRMSLNRFSCLHLPSAVSTGMNHHAWFCSCAWNWVQGLRCGRLAFYQRSRIPSQCFLFTYLCSPSIYPSDLSRHSYRFTFQQPREKPRPVSSMQGALSCGFALPLFPLSRGPRSSAGVYRYSGNVCWTDSCTLFSLHWRTLECTPAV